LFLFVGNAILHEVKSKMHNYFKRHASEAQEMRNYENETKCTNDML